MRLVLPVAITLMSGCVAHRTGDAVRNVTFDVEGRAFPRAVIGPDSDRLLRREMAQSVSSWQSLVFPGAIDPEWLDRPRLDDDGEAIELWLVEHGHLDARFLRWEIVRHGRKNRRMHPVTLRGYIDEGPPSHLRTLTVEGLEDVRPRVAKRIRADLPLVAGRVFTTDAYDASLALVRSRLLDDGYAFEAVTGWVDGYPAQHAVDAHLVVTAGPRSRFGKIEIRGLRDMPERLVRDAVTFKEGDRFRPAALSDTRTALFALKVFSSVNVTPTLEDPASATVPVVIEVKSGKWRRVKAGVGVEAETGKGTVYGTVEWEDDNLDHRLWTFKQTAKPGVAGVVAQDTAYQSFSLSQVSVGPIVDLTSVLTIPRALGPTIAFDANGRVQLGMEAGYRYFSPELEPALTWRPLRRRGRDVFTLRVGHELRYFDYFDFSVDIQDITDSPLGLDLTDPYLLSVLNERLTWDTRDNLLSPTRGIYGTLLLGEAGGPLLGNFDYVRTEAEVRAYRAVPPVGRWDPRLIIAGRVGTGIIAPYGPEEKASVPYAERLYLGGGTSVRGWIANRLGPQVSTTGVSSGEDVLVPAGGLFDLFGNFELRKVVAGPVSVAAFTDAGRVWAEVGDARFQGIQWSVGGGLRYRTGIGPLRGDVAFRVSPDDPELPPTPDWTVHFGLAEAF